MTENTQNTSVPLPTSLTDNVNETDSNPLSQYFRHTKLELYLPSAGKFYPKGA